MTNIIEDSARSIFKTMEIQKNIKNFFNRIKVFKLLTAAYLDIVTQLRSKFFLDLNFLIT